MVDKSLLIEIEQIVGEDKKDTRLLREMAEEAKLYLNSFGWCKKIRAGWFGWGIGGVCAVFLFEIAPSRKNIDDQLWVIVGDLPPAYLVTDDSPTAFEALKNYVELMEEWVEAVQAGKSIEGCIPVDAAATAENADLLRRRVEFLKKNVLA